MTEPDPFERTADPLGEALHFIRLSGTFYCRSELTAPWGLEMPAMESSMWFHVVTEGRCALEADGLDLPLLPGDFVLVPHGRGHRLRTSAAALTPAVIELPQEMVSERYSILRYGGGGARTSLVCGVVRFEHPFATELVALLPPVIHLDAASGPDAEWMQSTLKLMAVEARQLLPGGETVVTRLADVLVIQAIRAWLRRAPLARTGWLGALRDERIGRAIMSVHREPEHPWTVASLAARASMSRSAFAARFLDLAGEAPMQYVTRHRIRLAQASLAEGGANVGELATQLGYRSEAAFSRAFKRVTGISPRDSRRAADARRRRSDSSAAEATHTGRPSSPVP